MSKQVTIRDVAREAGVSRQTVSRAFNDKGEISAETKQQILETARRMGYRPSNVARSLSTNRTYTVGMLIPDITSPFFSHMVRGAEEAAAAAGYNLFLVNTFRGQQREFAALDGLWGQRVDGAILYGSFLSTEELLTQIDRIRHSVLINCEVDSEISDRAALFNVDDEAGAALAVDHLLKRGCTRIAFLSYQRYSLSGRRRVTGYRQALECHGVTVDETLIRECFPSPHSGYEETVQLLQEHPDVDAILAHNDNVAVHAIHACEDAGRTVPDDVAVMGYDDSPIAKLIRPALTTVRIDKQALGAAAMQGLLAMIEKNDSEIPAPQVITPRLLLRDSAP